MIIATRFPLLRTLVVTAALTFATAACTMPGSMDGCSPGASQGTSTAGLQQVTLCVTSKDKTRAFTVEIAATSQQQAQGMMYRESMADDTGMIFPFDRPRPASFWMKNTLIPLDIIFVRENGTIESIAADTAPYSEEPVTSQGTVGSVLELRGGLTAELGIKAGDKVVWSQP